MRYIEVKNVSKVYSVSSLYVAYSVYAAVKSDFFVDCCDDYSCSGCNDSRMVLYETPEFFTEH
ncbi:MAG: hypothetical protein Q4F21_01440 [Lachnospiraceae bacterium]|nr:hypothetical protein [Lachnospiraceae bacterium]